MTTSFLKAQDLIKTEIITLGLEGKIEPYYYISKKKAHKLLVSRTHITGPIKYEGSSSLKLYLNEPTEEAIKNKKSPLPKPDLQVKLDPRKGQILLLFSETPTSDSGEKNTGVKALPLSNKNSSRGDYQVLNFSTKDLYISIADQKKKLQAQGSKTFSSPAWKQKITTLPIVLGMKRDDKIDVAYSSRWGHRPNQRVLLFVFDKPGKKPSLSVRRFFDHPQGT